MTAAFFIGLILLSHPSQPSAVLSSHSLPSMEACLADVYDNGMVVAMKQYAPYGWILEDAYCVQVTESDSIRQHKEN